MKFAYDFTSFVVMAVAVASALFVLLFAGLQYAASIVRQRAVARFGEPSLITGLTSFDATWRRAIKAVLLTLALALAFVAFARPQFGRGTRLVPATNLDVVLVLDFSKSMFARDVVPSRIARAKAEVAQLVRSLPGARFGAVAFAGEPLSFPLTSDGAAIIQFFQGMDPNDMPVGGTATARALRSARELLARDPKSKEHMRVIVLVTDGEDLEGDPVGEAQACASEGTRVDVVQIGGRAPEVIPDVNADGRVVGIRRDESGKPLTTELTAEGEEQLTRIAKEAHGTIVRAEQGKTGIEEITKRLGKMMREELSERVETVFEEEYRWPLGAALLLLVVEGCLPEAPRPKQRRRAWRAILGLSILGWLLAACGWNPSRPFERESPEVKRAISDLDAGDASSATHTLEAYLSTGACESGNIGTPPSLKERPQGSFDLGLALFGVAESFGRRFGEEEFDGGSDNGPRENEVDCALRVVRAVALDDNQPIELRSRAHYLEGNLLFLARRYEEAVKAYDKSLALWPGLPDAGDRIGRDAAFNRAIALKRIEDKRDAGPDASPPDAGSDGGRDSGNDGGRDGGGDGGGEQDGSPPNRPDAGHDAGNDGASPDENDAGSPPPDPDAGAPPPPKSSQDDAILDQLENTPTVQHHLAKQQAKKRRASGMQDK